MISPSLEEALLRFRSPQVDSFLKKKKKLVGRGRRGVCVCIMYVCMYVYECRHTHVTTATWSLEDDILTLNTWEPLRLSVLQNRSAPTSVY